MQNVLTLMADDTLDASLIARAGDALRAAGAALDDPVWLMPDKACDLPFETMEPEAAAAILRPLVAGRRVDIAAQASAGRRKKLLVADMESTIIENEMLDELAELVGIRERVSAITERAMRGELDFEGAIRERVGLLAGMPESDLLRAAERIRITPGAPALVATMKAHGATCALVSGGFTHFTALIRDQLGFDLDQANRLEIEAGKLNGKVVEPILGRDAKRTALLKLAQDRKISAADAIAVGDGANDLDLLAEAGSGVAFRAKPVVAEAAKLRIDHCDLSALLYIQGYTAEEIKPA